MASGERECLYIAWQVNGGSCWEGIQWNDCLLRVADLKSPVHFQLLMLDSEGFKESRAGKHGAMNVVLIVTKDNHSIYNRSGLLRRVHMTGGGGH